MNAGKSLARNSAATSCFEIFETEVPNNLFGGVSAFAGRVPVYPVNAGLQLLKLLTVFL